MTREFYKELNSYFDDMNSGGLGELLLFSKEFSIFVESEIRRDRLLKAIVDICDGYDVNARKFAALISYEDFKKRKGISEISALGLKLFLLYQCGVEWTNINKRKEI